MRLERVCGRDAEAATERLAHAVGVEVAAHQDEPPHPLWCAEREQHADVRAIAVADDVGRLDAERVHHREHVARHRFVRDRARLVGGAAMTSALRGDDTAHLREVLRQERQHVHGLESAVEQQQRLALAVLLYVGTGAAHSQVAPG